MMLVRVGMAASGGQDELAELLSVWVVLVVVMQDGSGSGSSSILVLMKGHWSSVWVTKE